PTAEVRRYDRILQSKDFTYSLFSQLARDFNGDVFEYESNEEFSVTDQHLHRLRSMLLGQGEPSNPPLFFWAYDFSIVPIGLISSIYEEFYRTHDHNSHESAHYTPVTLVDFALTRVLTEQILATKPKIL